MTNQEQRKEIQQYLLDQNMAINIMLEVSDHMISQVDELMFDGKTFEEAFASVKEGWKKELEIILWNNEKKMPRLQANIIDKVKKEINQRSWYLTFGLIAFIFLCSKVLHIEYFRIFYQSLLVALLAFPILLILMNFNHIKDSRVNGKPLVFAEYIYRYIYGGIALIVIDVFSIDRDVEDFYHYSFGTILTLISMILGFSSVLYGTMAMMKFSKDIRKVKAYRK